MNFSVENIKLKLDKTFEKNFKRLVGIKRSLVSFYQSKKIETHSTFPIKYYSTSSFKKSRLSYFHTRKRTITTSIKYSLAWRCYEFPIITRLKLDETFKNTDTTTKADMHIEFMKHTRIIKQSKNRHWTQFCTRIQENRQFLITYLKPPRAT